MINDHTSIYINIITIYLNENVYSRQSDPMKAIIVAYRTFTTPEILATIFMLFLNKYIFSFPFWIDQSNVSFLKKYTILMPRLKTIMKTKRAKRTSVPKKGIYSKALRSAQIDCSEISHPSHLRNGIAQWLEKRMARTYWKYIKMKRKLIQNSQLWWIFAPMLSRSVQYFFGQ